MSMSAPSCRIAKNSEPNIEDLAAGMKFLISFIISVHWESFGMTSIEKFKP